MIKITSRGFYRLSNGAIACVDGMATACFGWTGLVLGRPKEERPGVWRAPFKSVVWDLNGEASDRTHTPGDKTVYTRKPEWDVVDTLDLYDLEMLLTDPAKLADVLEKGKL